MPNVKHLILHYPHQLCLPRNSSQQLQQEFSGVLLFITAHLQFQGKDRVLFIKLRPGMPWRQVVKMERSAWIREALSGNL